MCGQKVAAEALRNVFRGGGRNFLKISRLCGVICLLVLCGCRNSDNPHYVVGVSQCSDDAWRQRMNKELETELVFHPDITLRFRQADANSAVQCVQIDSFVSEQIDLLIVSPNEAAEVQSAVAHAYKSGIPVVVADRRVSGGDWTAFVGGDNQQVGCELGKWLLQCPRDTDDSLRVLEVAGLRGSTPSVARHEGMMSTIVSQPTIVVKTVYGQWFSDPAFELVDSLLVALYCPDVIVAQNDQMAIGAARACNKHGLSVPILGVDAIAGQGGGLEAILNGDIVASALYPSHGDMVLRVASDILHGRSYPRETRLPTMLIDMEKARVMQNMVELVDYELDIIHQLQSRITMLSSKQSLLRILIYTLIVMLLMLVAFAVGAYRVLCYRARVNKERAEHAALMQKQQEHLEQITAKLKQSEEFVPEEEVFLRRLQQLIEQYVDDPNLGVEMLSRELGMSRTALFRKTKAAIGQSPIELIHHVRLHKAQELLQKSDLTVQQVAYSVGFSTPSFFTKKYKEKFGVSPSDKSGRTKNKNDK